MAGGGSSGKAVVMPPSSPRFAMRKARRNGESGVVSPACLPAPVYAGM